MTTRATEIVTASYAPDFERCRLLCETIDQKVSGWSRHLILVADNDVGLFRQLEGKDRTVIAESDLLPHWLRRFPDPTSLFRRQVWLSRRTRPLRGWHVQQLRRMAIARHSTADAFFYCDSDVVFARNFDCAGLWHGDDLRLYREDNRLSSPVPGDQYHWSENAGRILGIAQPKRSLHDYIGTLIAWRRDTLAAMLDHIEAVHGRHWIETVGSDRRFSECMIYGRYADEVAEGRGHFHDGRNLCSVHWFAPAPDRAEIIAIIRGLLPWQPAFGIQSFLKSDPRMLRECLLEAAA